MYSIVLLLILLRCSEGFLFGRPWNDRNSGYYSTPYGDQLDLFRTYITSETGGPAYFGNAAQVRREQKRASKEMHPYARHVNIDITNRILNRSTTAREVYVLEETYFWRRDNATVTLSPLLFLLDLDDNKNVRLTSFKRPERIDVTSLLASNPYLYFNRSELVISPKFPIRPSYKFDRRRRIFTLNAVTKVPSGFTFSLIENISARRLAVLEKLQAVPNGPNIIGFETPILYDRLTGYDDFFKANL